MHLLIQVGDVPLGCLMLRIAGRFARTIQRHLRTTGHLFEKRYHPVLVDADEYLLELLRYIHLNPVRARMVSTAGAYPWSSHHAYLGTRTEAWLTTDFALAMFHADRPRAVAAYSRFIGERAQRVSARRMQSQRQTNSRQRRICEKASGRIVATEVPKDAAATRG